LVMFLNSSCFLPPIFFDALIVICSFELFKSGYPESTGDNETFSNLYDWMSAPRASSASGPR